PDRAHAARPSRGGDARPGVPLLDAVAGAGERAPRLQRHGARRRGARRGLPGGPRAPELRAPALRVEPGARARVRGRVRRGAPPMRLAPCVMVQGTASGVGKSLLAAALCRIFARGGYRVAPFKSQNMALNSAVTADGGEIGRAQAQQAAAAGIEPTVDMNPILLKPEAEARSQVVVLGRPWRTLAAAEYRARTGELLDTVARSLERLRRTFDVVVIEGAGSPAEINLLEHEIVNMRIARLADAPVILVG